MRIVLGDDSMHRWVASRILGEGDVFDQHLATLGVVDKNDNIIAGMVYHHPRGNSIEESFAAQSPRWAHPDVIGTLLAIAFEVLGFKRINSLIELNNERSIRITEGIGFKREGLLRDAGQFGDLLLLGLTINDFNSGKFASRRLEQYGWFKKT